MSPFSLDRLAVGLLPGEITWSLHFESECESTQDVARAAADAGADEGWTVVTDLQHSGRGRQGHTWIAPAGQALLVSIVLRPAVDVLPKLPLLAGLAVAGGIEASAGVAPDLKWPNDVLLRHQKLAGVLLERPGNAAVMLGIGVNVDQARADLPEGATSLSIELGRPVARERLLAAILNDLSNAYERADREGVQWIVPAWRSRSSMLGQRVRFEYQGTGLEGVAKDISDEGALQVETSDGHRLELVAGEVQRVRLV